MGLCKCPKKKVTNLFCFEHRVNVCEHCLTANHSRCVVQSYLQWLQDSDYNPNCLLCGASLQNGEVVRLLCLDIFHWDCLNNYAKQFPSTTAPAGYQCPSCTQCIFPASNQASPIADELRSLLHRVNWSRAGLGLPLIEEDSSTLHNDVTPAKVESSSSTAHQTHNFTSPVSHSVVEVDSTMMPHARAEHRPLLTGTSLPRKMFDTSSGSSDPQLSDRVFDIDENKYKQKSIFETLSRIFSLSRSSKHSRQPPSKLKKFLLLVIVSLIVLLTLVMIMKKLGRSGSITDPMLDPMANPNIRVADPVLN